MRQSVLTLPYRLRYRLAWAHALCRAVLGVYARGLLAFSARTARSHGIQDGQTGTVTVIPRFGGGLPLHVHVHTLGLDGVFREARPRPLTFPPAPPPSDEDVAQVLATVRARVGRRLARRQLEPADDSAPPAPLSETSPVLAGLVSASVQGRVALGPRAGARPRQLPRAPPGPARRLRSPRPRLGPPPPIAPASNRSAAYAELRISGRAAPAAPGRWDPPTRSRANFGFPIASRTPVDTVLHTPGLTADEQMTILGGNAAKLLKM